MVLVVLSDKRTSKYVKMENVYFGLTDIGELVEVCDMSEAEWEHARFELALGN